MIHLVDKFANGCERDVYIHPNDHKIVVKIRRKNTDKDRNAIEADFYKRLDEVSKSLLPNYYGWVKTNLGLGTAHDAIRNTDGSISKTLSKSAADGDLCKMKGEDVILKFFDTAIKKNLLMYDVSLDNLVCQWCYSGPRLILVDGYGPEYVNLKALLRYKINFLARVKIKKLQKETIAKWRKLF